MANSTGNSESGIDLRNFFKFNKYWWHYFYGPLTGAALLLVFLGFGGFLDKKPQGKFPEAPVSSVIKELD